MKQEGLCNMDYTNDKFTLDNGKTYLVIEQVDLDNKTYLYIANRDDEKETKFVEIKDDNLIDIDPILFEDKILPLFVEKFNK